MEENITSYEPETPRAACANLDSSDELLDNRLGELDCGTSSDPLDAVPALAVCSTEGGVVGDALMASPLYNILELVEANIITPLDEMRAMNLSLLGNPCRENYKQSFRFIQKYVGSNFTRSVGNKSTIHTPSPSVTTIPFFMDMLQCDEVKFNAEAQKHGSYTFVDDFDDFDTAEVRGIHQKAANYMLFDILYTCRCIFNALVGCGERGKKSVGKMIRKLISSLSREPRYIVTKFRRSSISRFATMDEDISLRMCHKTLTKGCCYLCTNEEPMFRMLITVFESTFLNFYNPVEMREYCPDDLQELMNGRDGLFYGYDSIQRLFVHDIIPGFNMFGKGYSSDITGDGPKGTGAVRECTKKCEGRHMHKKRGDAHNPPMEGAGRRKAEAKKANSPMVYEWCPHTDCQVSKVEGIGHYHPSADFCFLMDSKLKNVVVHDEIKPHEVNIKNYIKYVEQSEANSEALDFDDNLPYQGTGESRVAEEQDDESVSSEEQEAPKTIPTKTAVPKVKSKKVVEEAAGSTTMLAAAGGGGISNKISLKAVSKKSPESKLPEVVSPPPLIVDDTSVVAPLEEKVDVKTTSSDLITISKKPSIYSSLVSPIIKYMSSGVHKPVDVPEDTSDDDTDDDSDDTHSVVVKAPREPELSKVSILTHEHVAPAPWTRFGLLFADDFVLDYSLHSYKHIFKSLVSKVVMFNRLRAIWCGNWDGVEYVTRIKTGIPRRYFGHKPMKQVVDIYLYLSGFGFIREHPQFVDKVTEDSYYGRNIRPHFNVGKPPYPEVFHNIYSLYSIAFWLDICWTGYKIIYKPVKQIILPIQNMPAAMTLRSSLVYDRLKHDGLPNAVVYANESHREDVSFAERCGYKSYRDGYVVMEVVDTIVKEVLSIKMFTSDLLPMTQAYATLAGKVGDEFKRLNLSVHSTVQQDTILYIYNIIHVLESRMRTTVKNNVSYTSVFR